MGYTDPRVVCAGWIDAASLCCAGDSAVTDCNGDDTALVFPWTDEELVLAASNILYARTCFRYPGTCSYTVWPYTTCNCHCHPCACGTWSILKLPTDYPIISIEEVRLDGIPFDSSNYRLDNSNWLVRMDGKIWPSCNSFDLPNTNSTSIQVDMTVGREPPIELKMAVADLACEMKKACNSDETCNLPPHVRSIARRGVEIDIDDITTLFKDGLFGLPSVDMAIKIHGNCQSGGLVFDPTRHHFRGYGVSD